MRNANYRPMQNQEAAGANIEIVIPCVEVESNEEVYCTLVETQGELTSVEVIQELGKIEDKVLRNGRRQVSVSRHCCEKE